MNIDYDYANLTMDTYNIPNAKPKLDTCKMTKKNDVSLIDNMVSNNEIDKDENKESLQSKIEDCNIGRWTDEEHDKFLEALDKFGKNWKRIQDWVGTRSTTQVRSHAQKYFSKLSKGANNSTEYISANLLVSPKEIYENTTKLKQFENDNFFIELLPNPKQKRKAIFKQCKPGKTHFRALNNKINETEENIKELKESYTEAKNIHSERLISNYQLYCESDINDLDVEKLAEFWERRNIEIMDINTKDTVKM